MAVLITLNDGKSKPSSPINARSQNFISSNVLPLLNTYNDNISNDPNLLRFSNSYLGPLFVSIDSIDN